MSTESYEKCDWCKRYFKKDYETSRSLSLPLSLWRGSFFDFCGQDCLDRWIAKRQPKEIVRATK